MARPAYSDDKISSIQGEIREAALLVFARVGYRGLTLRAVGRELGWTSAALYRYFPSKDDLLAALRVHGFQSMEVALSEARRREPDPLESARNLMRAYLRFAMDEPQLFSLMYELSQGPAAAWPEVRAARVAAFDQARAAAAAVIAAGSLEGDANHAAHVLWAGCHGLAALALADQLDLDCAFDELVEPLLLLLTNLPASLVGAESTP